MSSHQDTAIYPNRQKLDKKVVFGCKKILGSKENIKYVKWFIQLLREHENVFTSKFVAVFTTKN